MEIGSLITRAVLTVEKQDSLLDACVWMMERGVGSAVVLTDGKPTGVITDRDALRAIAQGLNAEEVTVGQFVNRKLTKALPDVELIEAARLMREKGFRHLVVVDGGEIAGVLSMRDIVRCWTATGATADVESARARAQRRRPARAEPGRAERV